MDPDLGSLTVTRDHAAGRDAPYIVLGAAESGMNLG